MKQKIYFDTEFLYRNGDNNLTEGINSIRPGINGETTGFLEFPESKRTKIERVYNNWESAYLFLKGVKESYEWDFFEIKIFEVGSAKESIHIDINGKCFLIEKLDYSTLRTDLLNACEIKSLMEHVTELYKSIQNFRTSMPSLIVGGNDGKHNNCFEF